MFRSLENLYIDTLFPNGVVLRGEVLREVLGHEVRALLSAFTARIKDTGVVAFPGFLLEPVTR